MTPVFWQRADFSIVIDANCNARNDLDWLRTYSQPRKVWNPGIGEPTRYSGNHKKGIEDDGHEQ
jgi:hypothetical protein